jgi:hypothetical protein
MVSMTELSLDLKIQTATTVDLNEINRLDMELESHFKSKFHIQSSLTRSLVSFQANKNRPVYRWYKYKEGFSASLVEHFFQKYRSEPPAYRLRSAASAGLIQFQLEPPVHC